MQDVSLYDFLNKIHKIKEKKENLLSTIPYLLKILFVRHSNIVRYKNTNLMRSFNSFSATQMMSGKVYAQILYDVNCIYVKNRKHVSLSQPTSKSHENTETVKSDL